MDKRYKKARGINTQYIEGGKWCGHCGCSRKYDDNNRCITCGSLVRNRIRNSKYREETFKRI